MRALAVGILTSLAVATAGAEEAPLVFALCEGRIASAEVREPAEEGEFFEVAIRLLPEAAEHLADLTEAHVGEVLEIRVGRGHVVRARIAGPIRSGLVATGGYATREEAEAARAAALASRTRSCAEAEAPTPPAEEAASP